MVVGGGAMVLLVVDGGAALVLDVDGEVLSTTPLASNWSAM